MKAERIEIKQTLKTPIIRGLQGLLIMYLDSK